MDPHPQIPWDRGARPAPDEVLAVRAERTALVRAEIEGPTDQRLGERTEPVEGPGWPPARAANHRLTCGNTWPFRELE
jgi:hypothetical protein